MRSRARQLELPFPPTSRLPAASLPRRVAELTALLLEKARERWPGTDLPDIRIEFRLRGRAAGEACGATLTTNYNRELLERYGERFIREIVPHEVAHVVVARLHPARVKPHGVEWKEVMAFFGAKASASHEFETRPARRAGRFPYRCRCDAPHYLTRRVHRRLRRGLVEYTCRACGEGLEFAG